jgi:hypothetical protein
VISLLQFAHRIKTDWKIVVARTEWSYRAAGRGEKGNQRHARRKLLRPVQTLSEQDVSAASLV